MRLWLVQISLSWYSTDMKTFLWLLTVLVFLSQSQLLMALERSEWDHLFGLPEYEMPRLSPDGTRLAWLAQKNGVLNVWWKPLSGGTTPVQLSLDQGLGVRDFFWSADGLKIYALRDRSQRGEWRLYQLSLEDGLERPVAPQLESVRVLYHDLWNPDQLVVGVPSEQMHRFDLHRLNLTSGHLEFLHTGEISVGNWYFDGNCIPRLRTRTALDGSVILEWRPDPSGSLWTPAGEWHQLDASQSSVIRLNQTGNEAYLVDCTDADATRLIRVRLDTRDRFVAAEKPGRDVSWHWTEPGKDFVAIVGFSGGSDAVQVLDFSLGGIWEHLSQQFTGKIRIIHSDQFSRYWIIRHSQFNRWPEYWLYSKADKKLTLLGRVKDNSTTAAGVGQKIHYRSLDGTLLEAILTLPEGKSPSRVPMVLLLREALWMDATDGVNPDVAWLVDHGWGCLQPVTRGTPGQGKEFLQAADLHWADLVAQDVVDCATWALNEGIAEPQRLVVMGRGPGGTLALLALLRGGDTFRGAVAVSFLPDPEAWLTMIPPGLRELKIRMAQKLGVPGQDVQALHQVSPARRVNEFKKPLFIAHGTQDPWIPVIAIASFVDELQTLKQSVVFHRIANEPGPQFSLSGEISLHEALGKYLDELQMEMLPPHSENEIKLDLKPGYQE